MLLTFEMQIFNLDVLETEVKFNYALHNGFEVFAKVVSKDIIDWQPHYDYLRFAVTIDTVLIVTNAYVHLGDSYMRNDHLFTQEISFTGDRLTIAPRELADEVAKLIAKEKQN